MKKLLTMNELTITEIEKILHEAECFANGTSWIQSSRPQLPISSLNQVHVQKQALKWLKENWA